jgi:hypothetical protein
MERYLTRDLTGGDMPGLDATTGTDGTFAVRKEVTGSGHHEVWAIVRCLGYREAHVRIWEGDGPPSDESVTRTVSLTPNRPRRHQEAAPTP